MEKVIYFKNENGEKDYCVAGVYKSFLDYAFLKADYFMLVYINFYGQGLSEKQAYFKDRLSKFEVKRRNNPKWPGVLGMICRDTTYEVIFYSTSPEAKDALNEVSAMSDWSRPGMPEDLAFFTGNQCWFYSVGHEKIAAIVRASCEDIEFVELHGLASREKAFVCTDGYYEQYDEELI